MYDKFKYILKDDGFFYGALIVLIAISSFGLGRVSTGSLMPRDSSLSQSAGISYTQKATSSKAIEEIAGTSTETQTSGVYVGSKNGTKYHLETCPGAKQIKEENKVFFASKEEAQASGYSPASNCKGI